MSKDCPIKEDWEVYYKLLEGIRRTGEVNMYGASIYLREFCPELSYEQSNEILVNWMDNYSELSEKYSWRN